MQLNDVIPRINTWSDSPGDKAPKWLLDYRVPLPKEGLVPDKETAIQIAEIVLFRLYGKENIIAQRPYEVKEEDYIWWISGTLKGNAMGSPNKIAISKQTGAVLHVE
ncbi:MAG: YbbC/YhhH family protein [Verrucomicrobiota bacterium]|nr:YbbC/YhhH family protein [Verrucomicrobiota bacterium]